MSREEKKSTERVKFVVPSLSDIKQASKISTQSKPSLFKISKSQVHSAQDPLDQDSGTKRPDVQCVKQGAASTSGISSGERASDVIPYLHMPTPSGQGEQEPRLIAHVTKKPHSRPSEQSTGSPVTQFDHRKDVVANETSHGSAQLKDDERTAARSGQEPKAPVAGTSDVVPKSYNPRSIAVNVVQKNNPLMKHIRNVPWELGNIVPDFELGRTTCALFLSVKYHSLHPDYIHSRLKELGKQYQLRILLVQVDTSESQHALQELAKIALLTDLTLILTWSPEESARYLETYKAYENKPPDLIMERVDSDFSSRVIESLTTVKKVNKTDAATLLNNFKTMEKLIHASKEELTLCPGLGSQKAQRLHDLFHEPFLKVKKPKFEQ